MSVVYGKGPKGKATRLHAELVRARGVCEAWGTPHQTKGCSGRSNLTTAHIVPRGWSATRTDERNAFCLCASCHAVFGEHTGEWMAFVDATIGRPEFDRLWAKARAGGGPRKLWEWEAEVARLSALVSGQQSLDDPSPYLSERPTVDVPPSREIA